jgi:formamidopyrimidine-DNA glycosylase
VPELPDIEVYIRALRPRMQGRTLVRARINHPFLVRSVDPPMAEAAGKRVESNRRLGKRIVFHLQDELALVLHLMIAGRLHWRAANAKLAGRTMLGAFDVEDGSLVLTEAGTKRRAALHLVRGAAALAAHDPGGIEVLDATLADFAATLRRERHTLKRALTDPTLFSGIGNSYGDEILHAARLSPVAMTSSLSDEDIARLFAAARSVLTLWIDRLAHEAGEDFPAHVTAFHAEMAAHGHFRRPCPRCGTPIQRIVRGEHEANYCPACQTGGRLLADRALSRVLGADWPKTVEELERRRAAARRAAT